MADIVTPVADGTKLAVIVLGNGDSLFPGVIWDALGGEVLGQLVASPDVNSINGRLKSINSNLVALLGEEAEDASIQALITALNTMSAKLPATAGRKAAGSSLAVVLSNEDLAALAAPVLASGENHVGAVGGHTAVATASFVRPADTIAYAIGDLIANNVTPGGVAAMSLNVARVNGGTGCIRRVRVSRSGVGTGADVVRVHLFKGPAAATAPGTTTGGDNLAFSGAFKVVTDIHIGSFDVTLDKVGSDGCKGTGAPAVGGEVSFDCYAGQTNIYALLEARSAFTPLSGETFTVAAEVFRD